MVIFQGRSASGFALLALAVLFMGPAIAGIFLEKYSLIVLFSVVSLALLICSIFEILRKTIVTINSKSITFSTRFQDTKRIEFKNIKEIGTIRYIDKKDKRAAQRLGISKWKDLYNPRPFPSGCGVYIKTQTQTLVISERFFPSYRIPYLIFKELLKHLPSHKVKVFDYLYWNTHWENDEWIKMIQ